MRSALAIDRHVGAQIRMYRRQLRMSQTALAGLIGVTFQQVQKYERGANRVSASKLFQAASALGVPIEAFFEGLPVSAADDNPVWIGQAEALGRLMDSPEGAALAELFPLLQQQRLRRALAHLVRVIARPS